jgi:hypothetical protein
MPKRKSGQGAGPAKMQRLKSSNDLVAEGLNHVQKITDWSLVSLHFSSFAATSRTPSDFFFDSFLRLRETVHPAGGPDQWLERTYKTEVWVLPFVVCLIYFPWIPYAFRHHTSQLPARLRNWTLGIGWTRASHHILSPTVLH